MKDLRLRLTQNLGLLLAIGLFLLFWLTYNFNHPKGFSTVVLVQNANEAFVLAMVAMAQTVPVLMGGLDLSVGAVMTLVNCLASVLVNGSGGHILLGVVICLAAGTLAGLVNGLVVVYGRIQPIIATLATGAIYMGLALFIRPTPGGNVDEDLSWAFSNELSELAATYGLFEGGEAAWFRPFAWLPVPLVLAVLVVVLVWLPFRNSVTGRGVYAIGSAEGAAYMSGVRIERCKLAAFTLAGFFAAVGGLFLALQTSSGNADVPQAGAYTLNSIAAVVLGGTSLMGGSGGAIGSLIGALVIRAISFNFRIFEVAPLLQPLVEGLVLLAAVSLGAARVLRVRNRLELLG
ncbi:MAG TPA: ABC transporter permease [Geminicoccaceae bacterium]|nr:ABC transporter permease [Geminicoccus sp.]HMU49364.1 ABC transporter permease [Geminicoccaceae bacterium]